GDKMLSLNITAAQLRSPDFADEIQVMFDENNYPPSQLVLEFTESCVIDNSVVVIENIKKLHQIGVKFALDDFGKGYGSIDYIRRFPIDVIKIDKEFVKDIGKDSENE